MLNANVWRRALGVDRATVIEEIDFDEESETVVVLVRPRRATKRRCGLCGTRSPGYDQGEGRRNWRTLDLGTMRCYLQADLPRVRCSIHGPTVAQVPWARHGAGHTRDFDDQVAWLVTHSPKSTVAALMRVAWRTVGSIIERVVTDARAAHDPFDGLRRIGVDEISYKRGHRYLTIVVDHDSGRLVWAAVGRDKATLGTFFDLLGDERSGLITIVTADGAEWIAQVVAERCANATLCIDNFHVTQWASRALDEVRRQVWNEARRGGMSGLAQQLKGCRYALWRNPEDLSERQAAKLAWIAQVNSPLYRAYLLKEQLRTAIATKGTDALALIKDWLAWAQRCRIPAFVELGRKIKRLLPGIEAAMIHRVSNGLVESTNTKLRVLHRMAFGFKKPEHLIALALLDRGGYCPDLPGRNSTRASALALASFG
ncbi:MAG: ISL3 family transposase [Acidimicrobiales bacterium]